MNRSDFLRLVALTPLAKLVGWEPDEVWAINGQGAVAASEVTWSAHGGTVVSAVVIYDSDSNIHGYTILDDEDVTFTPLPMSEHYVVEMP
jgi:hypothetical protein